MVLAAQELVAPEHAQFLDLIKALLRPDPQLRITAAEALRYPLFARSSTKHVAV